VLKKVKEHHRKKAKEAKKLGLNGRKKVEKDPGIPNDWPFKDQEIKALEARRAKALEELEQKKAARKERVNFSVYSLSLSYCSSLIFDCGRNR
jgi:nuclear GTP-binding protein